FRSRPDTPSLTRPTERPESNTISTPINATTAPIKTKRPRAKDSSRRARNMTHQHETYRHSVDKSTWLVPATENRRRPGCRVRRLRAHRRVVDVIARLDQPRLSSFFIEPGRCS